MRWWRKSWLWALTEWKTMFDILQRHRAVSHDGGWRRYLQVEEENIIHDIIFSIISTNTHWWNPALLNSLNEITDRWNVSFPYSRTREAQFRILQLRHKMNPSLTELCLKCRAGGYWRTWIHVEEDWWRTSGFLTYAGKRLTNIMLKGIYFMLQLFLVTSLSDILKIYILSKFIWII